MVLDSELYKELFGDDELLKDIADILGVGEEETSEGEIVDTVIKIFQVINEVEEVISEFDWKLKGAQLLVKVLLREYNKRVERFQNFFKKKNEILDEKNNDIYYEHIGDNFYSKNYIGFKSVQDIDKFLRFDYEIYKKIFPNFSAANAALAPVIILSIFLFPQSSLHCFCYPVQERSLPQGVGRRFIPDSLNFSSPARQQSRV